MQFLCLVYNNKNVNSDRALVDNTVLDVTTTPKGNFWVYLRDKEPTSIAENCTKKTNKIVAGSVSVQHIYFVFIKSRRSLRVLTLTLWARDLDFNLNDDFVTNGKPYKPT